MAIMPLWARTRSDTPSRCPGCQISYPKRQWITDYITVAILGVKATEHNPSGRQNRFKPSEMNDLTQL